MQRRMLSVGSMVGVLAVSTIARAGGTPLTSTRVVSAGLTRPLFVTHAPGDFDRVFIVEQPGQIGHLGRGQDFKFCQFSIPLKKSVP